MLTIIQHRLPRSNCARVPPPAWQSNNTRNRRPGWQIKKRLKLCEIRLTKAMCRARMRETCAVLTYAKNDPEDNGQPYTHPADVIAVAGTNFQHHHADIICRPAFVQVYRMCKQRIGQFLRSWVLVLQHGLDSIAYIHRLAAALPGMGQSVSIDYDRKSRLKLKLRDYRPYISADTEWRALDLRAIDLIMAANATGAGLFRDNTRVPDSRSMEAMLRVHETFPFLSVYSASEAARAAAPSRTPSASRRSPCGPPSWIRLWRLAPKFVRPPVRPTNRRWDVPQLRAYHRFRRRHTY